MKKRRFFTTFAALLLIYSILAGCGGQNEPDTTGTGTTKSVLVQTKIAALKGPTGIGMVQLTGQSEQYAVTFAGAPTEIPAMLTSKSADIAAMPLNLAASLYNKSGGSIQLLAVNTLGVLYILEKGNSIQNVADLKGKTLYATGKGSTPEYILNYILKTNGLEGDVTLEFKNEHSELATLAAAGNVTLCMLPEPNVTAALKQNMDLRIALDMTKEWEMALSKNGQRGSLAQGCLVVRKQFAQAHPQEVAAFLQNYRQSVDFVNNDMQNAAQLVAQAGILPSAAVAEQAIPNCNIVCLTGNEMRDMAVQNLQVLLEADAASVGGSLPAADFYFGADAQ